MQTAKKQAVSVYLYPSDYTSDFQALTESLLFLFAMDRETLEIVRAFVIESLDSLDEQEGKIQGILESSSKESINSIFRVFHTIKGLSGFLNFNTVNTVTHEAETLLDILRNKPEIISHEIIDVVYESFDVLRTLLNTVASVMKDTGNEEIVRALITKLQAITHAIKTGAPLPVLVNPHQSRASSAVDTSVEAVVPSQLGVNLSTSVQTDLTDVVFADLDIDNMSEEELDASMAAVFDSEVRSISQTVSQSHHETFPDEFFFTPEQLSSLENVHDTSPRAQAAGSTHTLNTSLPENVDEFSAAVFQEIAPDILKRYITEAIELVTVAENGCLSLEQNPHDMTVVATIFGAVHSLKGNSGFMGFAEIEGMSMDLENILDAVRSKTLEVYPGLISMLLTNIDIIKNSIGELARQQNLAVSQPKKNRQESAPAPHRYTEPAQPPVRQEPEPVFNEQFLQNIWSESARQSENNSAADKIVLTEEQAIIVSEPMAKQEELIGGDSKTDTKDNFKAESKVESTPNLVQRRDIRVDMDKLDKLFDLVGELITIESMVTNNPEVQALELEGFNKAAAMLNKITRELQEVTMSIRMMPLEGLFNKMKRLVRDLSIRFDKKINLEIAGAETEMDKNVIEEISDPLMHIIRNAIDHGIESRQQRLAAGKNETGTIKLQARYEGNEILVIIEDDGGGINRTKIIEKAHSKGILKIAPEKMTDREVNALIFEPGFSTAEKITDISGRGVGMDVVKRNIEKLQGSIIVDTREGKGTRFTLRIPLTLAIMDAMMIRVGSSIYALPILAIRESFRPQQQAITITMDGQEIVRVREELFAVLRLHEVYDRLPDTTVLHEGILIIVESRGRKACVFVDEILGQQQIVVKNLSDYVGNVEGITGCMIQSNGEVGLIIDVDALLQQISGSMMLAYE